MKHKPTNMQSSTLDGGTPAGTHSNMEPRPGAGGEPWQLEMFKRSLKKQQKLQALLDIMGDVSGQRCLLVTCGDNNGALNWHFRTHGGEWSWAESLCHVRYLACAESDGGSPQSARASGDG